MALPLERAARVQGLVFCILAACISVLSSWLPRGSPQIELAVLIGLIVLLGVPHGAVDPAYMSVSFRTSSWRSWAVFIGRYLGLAAAVLVLWLVWPSGGLAAFLAMSAFHFSGDPVRGATVATRALQGTAVIALPALWHPVETEATMAYLAGGPAAAWCIGMLQSIALPLAFGVGVTAAFELRHGRMLVAAEVGTAAVLAITAPPLVSFTIYFCGMHSARHLLRTADRAGVSWSQLALLACVPMVSILATGFAVWRMLTHVPVDALAIRVVFIGLAMLTVPHMALVERVRFGSFAE